MFKKTSFGSVQPLSSPVHATLDKIGRCVHLDDFNEACTKGFLVPQPLSNSHIRLSKKVLWFAPCQSMSSHSYYGNVTFVIKWETVLQKFGPYLFLIDQAICNARSFTRVVLTRNYYSHLRSVDLNSEQSPMKKSWVGFQHVRRCLNKRFGGPHELQIGIEVNDDEARWLFQNCSKMANDHSLANTLYTGNVSYKEGANCKYESYKCYKFNTAQNRECPYKFTRDECQRHVQSVVRNTRAVDSFSYGRNDVSRGRRWESDASSAAERSAYRHDDHMRSDANLLIILVVLIFALYVTFMQVDKQL